MSSNGWRSVSRKRSGRASSLPSIEIGITAAGSFAQRAFATTLVGSGDDRAGNQQCQ